MNKIYLAYQRLNYKEKEIYMQLFNEVPSLRTQFVFNNADFESVKNAYLSFIADRPEFYWLTNGFRTNTHTTLSGSTVTLNPQLRTSNTSEMSRGLNLVKNVATRVATEAIKKRDIFERILLVHDYIVDTCEYVANSKNKYDIYGCLVDRKAVCAGYSAAFQYIMQLLSIPCGRIEGAKRGEYKGKADHEWNYIYIGNDAYHMDVTWDDPMVQSKSNVDNKTHEYFCLSENELLLSHVITGNQFVPRCTSYNMDYYRRKGQFLPRYSFEQVKMIAERMLAHSDNFQIKFGSPGELNRAKHDLLTNNKLYTIRGVNNRIIYWVSRTGLVLSIKNK